MAKEYLADKPTLDEVNSKVGTTGDAASGTSLFAKVNNLLNTLANHAAAWTSARAAKMDNLDAAISSRAPASTALSTAQWTNTRAGYLDKLNNAIYGLEAIKNAVGDARIVPSKINYLSIKTPARQKAQGTLQGKGRIWINGGTYTLIWKIVVDGVTVYAGPEPTNGSDYSGTSMSSEIFFDFNSSVTLYTFVSGSSTARTYEYPYILY